MSERNRQSEGISIRKAMAIGALVTGALVGQAMYIESGGAQQEQHHAQQVLELYGDTALAAGMVTAVRRGNQIMQQHSQHR